MADVTVWKDTGMPQHLQNLLQHTLDSNWSSFEGVPGIAVQQQVCGAGGPNADLMFAAAYHHWLRRLRAQLRQARLAVTLTTNGAAGFSGILDYVFPDQARFDDVSFCDDLAFAVEAPAERILDTISMAGSIAWKTFHLAGFEINFGPTI